MRDRLVELLKQGNNLPCGNGFPWEDDYCKNCEYGSEKEGSCRTSMLADYLLDNGVIVPPCWIGDKIYFVCGSNIAEYTVERAHFDLVFWQFHCENPAYALEHREFSFF